VNGKIVHDKRKLVVEVCWATKSLDERAGCGRIYAQAFGRPPSAYEGPASRLSAARMRIKSLVESWHMCADDRGRQ